MAKIVFLTYFVSNVSYNFYVLLRELYGDNVNVICFYDGPYYDTFNKATNRVLYYNDYIIDFHKNYQKSLNIISSSEVIFYSNMPRRVATKFNKKAIYIKISERIFKNRLSFCSFIRFALSSIKNDIKWPWVPKTYFLSIGGYTYGDYSLLGLYKKKAFNFGYFGPHDDVNINDYYSKHMSNMFDILWIGSLDYDKKLGETIGVIELLIRNGKDNFHVNIIGDGKYKKKYENIVFSKHIENYITFLGNVPLLECQNYMKKSSIFLATGGRLEGYNCSISMALNYGTICIANIACGSTIELIKNNQTGFSFSSFDELYEKMTYLLINATVDEKISIINSAFSYYESEWSTKVVVERFQSFVDAIANNNFVPFKSGVFACSDKNRYYFKKYKSE